MLIEDNPDPPTVGSDFGVGRVVVHSVLRGAGVPFGKDRSKVRISLSDAVQHGSARDILEGSLEVKSNKNSRVVSFRQVLDGFDHRICTIWSSNTVFEWSSTLSH